jgi:asparagine synthase (glutamine-hydrolysing)
MSMAHSLEVRVPLIDHEIVEFVCGLPPGWERRRGYPKRLLLESLSDVLPPAILDRPKQGFAFPLDHWMRNALRPLVESVLAPDVVKARGIFEPAAVRQLADGFFAGREAYPAVWQLVVLEMWLQHTLDPAAVS